jgi:hypothetical protein
MKQWLVCGFGTPIWVDAPSLEIAEAIVVETYGVDIDRLVTLSESDVVLR